MTWAQIRLLWLTAVGDNAAAREEAWLHLTQAHRLVTSDPNIDIPELAVIDTSVTIAAAADSIEMSTLDFDTFALLDGFNKTQGYPIHPEPGGMTGRRQYLDTTGKPPSGTITHYCRDGSKLYVRNTPAAETILILRARKQVAALSDADLNLSPLTPEQYDWPILYHAASNYHSVHPGSEDQPDLAGRFRSMAKGQTLDLTNVRALEDKPHRGTTRLRGYNLSPRSRWG